MNEKKMEVPCERWIEYISSVTIKVPEKWMDEAKPFNFANTSFRGDMAVHMNRIAEGLRALSGGLLAPNIFISPKPLLREPIVEINFWGDGIAELDADGEITDGHLILSSWDTVRVSDYAKLTFIFEAQKFRRGWMAKMEALHLERKQMEAMEYA